MWIELFPHREKAADLVLPSKLMGMMASGRPVVAMTCPDIQVARIFEGCGRVAPPNDAPGIAKAIQFLIESEQSRARLEEAGRAYAFKIGKRKLF